MHFKNKKLQCAHLRSWNERFHVVVETEVDHVKDAISGHDRGQAFVETSPAKAVISNDFASLGNS